MTIKEFKITPENLKRHLDYDKDVIYISCDKEKAITGELAFIDGSWWVMVHSLHWQGVDSIEFASINCYQESGFKTPEDMVEVLNNIHPKTQDIFLHKLVRIKHSIIVRKTLWSKEEAAE
ncbi:MAG: hypothetical protein PHX06_05910 [Methanocorpusculum parvum]|nr:hypothetical protein [Methanocorpusculum parvum]